MQKTLISPKERLMIAAQLLAGMQAPNYHPTNVDVAENLDAAKVQADALIEAMGCEVYYSKTPAWALPFPEVATDYRGASPVNDENGH